MKSTSFLLVSIAGMIIVSFSMTFTAAAKSEFTNKYKTLLPNKNIFIDTSKQKYQNKIIDTKIGNDFQMIKRNLFLSKGWGAAGTPLRLFDRRNGENIDDNIHQTNCGCLLTKMNSNMANLLRKSIDNDYFSNFSKRNMFTSLGWGAGGFPYEQTQDRITARFIEPVKSLRRREIIDGFDDNLKDKSDQIIVDEEPNKHYHIAPQLFVSRNWGPLG